MHTNFDLKKFLVENKLTETSKLQENWDKEYTVVKSELKEEQGKKLKAIKFPNGLSFEVGGKDPEGGVVIGIMKYGNEYEVLGQEYNWDHQEEGEEGYTYAYDAKGNGIDR